MMRAAVCSVAVLALSAQGLAAQEIEPSGQRMRVPAALQRFLVRPAGVTAWGAGWTVRTEAARRSGSAVSGELSLVVVPALFSDSPDPVHTHDDIARVYFTGPYVNGTMAEYYQEISGGRLSVTGDVRPWARTSLTRAEVVGAQWGLGRDAKLGPYLAEALSIVDLTTDFGPFDSDGPDGIPNSGDDDGTVDVVAFEFIEVAASCGGPGIWPHRWSLNGANGSPFTTNDTTPAGAPILVNGYIIQSTVACNGTDIHTATVMSHELGHALGLPDYRHHVGGITPEHRRWLVGCFELMSAGSWGCDDVAPSRWVNPSHMSPFPKLKLGWLGNVIEAPTGELVTVTLAPVQTSEQVLRLPLGGTEHLLIEYRDTIGFDRVLPASGVLIYRVNTAFSPAPCPSCEPNYGLYLEEADGRHDLRLTPLEGGNRGTAADVAARTAPFAMTNLTVPSTRLMDGRASNVNIYDVRVENGLARITYSTTPISIERLLQSLLNSSATPLVPGERQFLDASGNANGRYDVGDLRAYLRP